VILLAVTSFSATNYLAAFWHGFGEGKVEIAVAIAILAYVAVRNIMGFSARRAERILLLVVADGALQLLLIVLGLALFFNVDAITNQIDLGTAPQWDDVVFALTIATVAFTSLESASGLAGEVDVRRAGLKRLIASASASVTIVYFGIALVAVMALPAKELGSGSNAEAPIVAVAEQ